MKYRFLADYRHRWPSRAHTEFKAGMEMTLKREVIDYALPRGLIEPVRDRTTGGAVKTGNYMVGNGDPEQFHPIPMSDNRPFEHQLEVKRPTIRRKLRVTDGK